MTATPITKPDIIEQIDALDESVLAPEQPAGTVVPNTAPKPAAKTTAAKKAPAKKAPSKAVAKVAAPTKVVEAELPLDKPKAEALDKKIGAAVEAAQKAVGTADEKIEKLTALVLDAKHGQIHVELGFDSWTAYFTKRVQVPFIAIAAERKPVVALLHEAGMSQGAIAEAIGVSKATVNPIVQEIERSRPADEAPVKTEDARGRTHNRAKAGAAGKKAAAAKKAKAKDTGRATGKAPSRNTIDIGNMLTLVNGAPALSFNEGQINSMRAINVQITRILKDWDMNAANNKNAKA